MYSEWDKIEKPSFVQVSDKWSDDNYGEFVPAKTKINDSDNAVSDNSDCDEEVEENLFEHEIEEEIEATLETTLNPTVVNAIKKFKLLTAKVLIKLWRRLNARMLLIDLATNAMIAKNVLQSLESPKMLKLA